LRSGFDVSKEFSLDLLILSIFEFVLYEERLCEWSFIFIFIFKKQSCFGDYGGYSVSIEFVVVICYIKTVIMFLNF
jgi:hypothetical protein